MKKVCIICGKEFETRPVYHTCIECGDKFQKEMDEMIRKVIKK